MCKALELRRFVISIFIHACVDIPLHSRIWYSQFALRCSATDLYLPSSTSFCQVKSISAVTAQSTRRARVLKRGGTPSGVCPFRYWYSQSPVHKRYSRICNPGLSLPGGYPLVRDASSHGLNKSSTTKRVFYAIPIPMTALSSSQHTSAPVLRLLFIYRCICGYLCKLLIAFAYYSISIFLLYRELLLFVVWFVLLWFRYVWFLLYFGCQLSLSF
jgi:hypothetical protein